MWNEDRIAELEKLHDLLEAANSINKGSGAMERIHRVIELAGELSRSDRNSGRKNFTQFLVEKAHDDQLAIAAHAVVRDALDRVEVHPCDHDDDNVRAKGLSLEAKALYDALAAHGAIAK